MNDVKEVYLEEPEYFRDGQTTVDGYRWEKRGNTYVKIFEGAWDERSR